MGRLRFVDVLAFFNGGRRTESGSGYSFLSDAGLLHFAFLIDQMNYSYVEWLLKTKFSCKSTEYLRIYRMIQERFTEEVWTKASGLLTYEIW